MRGGSLPFVAFGTVLFILFIGNWIWNAKLVDAAAAGFAALVVYAGGVLVMARGGRRALHSGEPEPDPRPDAVPQGSTGAVIFALGFASFMFGFTFGSFLIYFGAALMILGLGRLLAEVRAEAKTRERIAGDRRQHAVDGPRP